MIVKGKRWARGEVAARKYVYAKMAIEWSDLPSPSPFCYANRKEFAQKGVEHGNQIKGEEAET